MSRVNQAEVECAVLDVIDQMGGVASPHSVMQALPWYSPSAIRAALRRQLQGCLERNSRGLYEIL